MTDFHLFKVQNGHRGIELPVDEMKNSGESEWNIFMNECIHEKYLSLKSMGVAKCLYKHQIDNMPSLDGQQINQIKTLSMEGIQGVVGRSSGLFATRTHAFYYIYDVLEARLNQNGLIRIND